MPKAVYTPFTAEDQQKPADEAVQGLLEHLRSEIEAKLGHELAVFKLIHYFTRLHGAPIHYAKVQVTEEKYAHVTLTLPRFGKQGPPTLADVVPDRKLEDPVEAYGLHFD